MPVIYTSKEVTELLIISRSLLSTYIKIGLVVPRHKRGMGRRGRTHWFTIDDLKKMVDAAYSLRVDSHAGKKRNLKPRKDGM